MNVFLTGTAQFLILTAILMFFIHSALVLVDFNYDWYWLPLWKKALKILSFVASILAIILFFYFRNPTT